MPAAEYYDGKKINYPISETATHDLFKHWTIQAVSSLLSAFASKTFGKHSKCSMLKPKTNLSITNLPHHERSKYSHCTKHADALQKHAECVMNALEASKKYQGKPDRHEEPETSTTVPKDGTIISSDEGFVTEAPSRPRIAGIATVERRSNSETLKKQFKNTYQTSKVKRVRIKSQQFMKIPRLRDQPIDEPERVVKPVKQNRYVKNAFTKKAILNNKSTKVLKADSYQLMSADSNRSPVGMMLKSITQTLRRIKNKPDDKPWKTTVLQIQQLEKLLHKNDVETTKKIEFLQLLNSKTVTSAKMPPKKIDKEYEELINDMPPMLREKFVQHMHQRKKDPIDTARLLRKAIKIGMTLAGQNTSDFDKKTVKLASPRFFSVVPDNNPKDINLFSPSLLSLHDDGKGAEKMLSLPNLIKSTKLMQEADQDDMLNLITEATGVADVVDTINDVKKKNDEEKILKSGRGIDGQPMYFTKENVTEIEGEIGLKKIEVFEKLHKSLDSNQWNEMNSTGYSLLNPEQLRLLYGKDSPYSSPGALERFLNIKNETELNELLHKDIAALKASESISVKMQKRNRVKRVVTEPVAPQWIVLNPALMSQLFVLAPVLFSPVILSPASLGPFVLSPVLFSPLILSPRVLSPLILSPLVFDPVILSPLALHPLILSPGVFNPFILSPLVLSPFILSPQVATPFILSPLCLTPLILTPMALSPLVFSPFVLSPLILSPQWVFALVGSPHALSPLIASNLTVSAVVASPSFLS